VRGAVGAPAPAGRTGDVSRPPAWLSRVPAPNRRACNRSRACLSAARALVSLPRPARRSVEMLLPQTPRACIHSEPLSLSASSLCCLLLGNNEFQITWRPPIVCEAGEAIRVVERPQAAAPERAVHVCGKDLGPLVEEDLQGGAGRRGFDGRSAAAGVRLLGRRFGSGPLDPRNA
jgi:hypothetical protein